MYLKFLSIGLLILLHSCASQKESERVKSVRVYCNCLRSTNDTIPGRMEGFACEGFSGLRVRQFVKPEFLFFHTTDSLQCERIDDLFFRTPFQRESSTGPTYARFVILVDRENRKCDTLSLTMGGRFGLNEKDLLKYRIDVVDSLFNILRIKDFDCRKRPPISH